MRYQILIVLFSLLINNSFAQRWLPPGTKLTYSEVEFSSVGMPIGLKPSPIYIVDTLNVKGKLCTYGSKIPGGANTGFLITYQDAGIVYWYRPGLDSFTVLFDFNKNIGDEWIIDGLYGGGSSPCSRTVKITDKKTVNINGYNLRSITIEFSTGSVLYASTVVESIGGLQTPYPDWYPCMMSGHVDDFTGYRSLRCINHPDIGFYDFKQAPSCDYSVTSINENAKPIDVIINPNPFVTQFTLSNNIEGNSEMYIYDILGRLVLNKTITKGVCTISSEDWSKGIYVLKLVSSEGMIYQCKLVKS